MTKPTLGKISLILGVLVVLLSAVADRIGLGKQPGFGWRHLLGIVLGVVLVWRGFTWSRIR